MGLIYLEKGSATSVLRQQTTYWLKIKDSDSARLKIVNPFARRGKGRISTVYLRARGTVNDVSTLFARTRAYATIKGVNAIWRRC